MLIKMLKEQIEKLKQLVELYKQILELTKQKKELEKKISLNEAVYQVAKSLLGKSIIYTRKDLGCANAVNYVFKKATGKEVGGGISTIRMYSRLKRWGRFTKVANSVRGDIIISPTTFGNGHIAHGHVGIISDNGKIMSNNSDTGLWDEHWTVAKWRNYYGLEGGFPVEFYRMA